PDEAEHGEHQDAHARAEEAAVDRDHELHDHLQRQPPMLRLAEAALDEAADGRLRHEQQRGAVDQPRHHPRERAVADPQDEQRPEPAADERRDRHGDELAPVAGHVAAKAPEGADTAGHERHGAGGVGRHRRDAEREQRRKRHERAAARERIHGAGDCGRGDEPDPHEHRIAVNIRDPTMTRELPDAERLTHALQQKGWQPARGDIEPLFALVAGGDRDAAEAASRALARLGLDAARAAIARFDAEPPVARARLTRLVGRVAQAKDDRALAAFLIARIADDDEKTARNAALALGKLGATRVDAAGVERALLSRWSSATPALRRALAEALGKLGGAAALDVLDRDRDRAGDDAELARVSHEARVKIRRTLGRADAGAILDDVAPAAPLPLVAHCRHGLTALLAEELSAAGAGNVRIADDETVSLTLRAPLASLWRARTMLRFGFPLRTRGRDLEAAVVDALSSDAAAAILSRFTRGTIRYRLEWSDAGHRRALTYRVAAAVAARRPAHVNDPTATLWEAVVRESGGHLSVELWPRGLPDPRFAYRVAHVPASSHPTLAAALARVADAALERARDNLTAAAVEATLTRADARSWRPPISPTAIITNPPMGRRVLDRHKTVELYRDFLAHAAALLPRDGRLTWISPRGDETLAVATPLGLRVTLRQRVDMAGFWGEIQSFTKR